MRTRPRIYDAVLVDHLAKYRQMAFVSGPRQVGKTTTCRARADAYLNWDNQDSRELILKGPSAVAEYAGLTKLADRPRVVVFDELHRYSQWKLFLKGFFDTYEDTVRIVVTGSSRLDVYRRGGDSLMGRYFLLRMHPFGVGELAHAEGVSAELVSAPRAIEAADWSALVEHGGYPEPFLHRDSSFGRRWQNLRFQQLTREDLRDLTRIQELDQVSVLARILAEMSGRQVGYSGLARQIRVGENTVRSWISALCALNYGFTLRPWFRNVARSIRKEPKWYLRDWAGVTDPGFRAETMVACHLLKAVDAWIDAGYGRFELCYIRDKEKREVDFVVTRDDSPWFLVEAKTKDTALSPSLSVMQRQTGAGHAFQAVLDESFVDADCFSRRDPVVVPLRTLLSQLP